MIPYSKFNQNKCCIKCLLALAIVLLVGCSKPLESLQPKAEQAVQRWACDDLQSSLFDVAYAALIDLKTIPTQAEFLKLFEGISSQKKTEFDQVEFLKTIGDFYEIILSQSHDGVESMLEKVAAAELGSQENAEAQKVQRDLSAVKQRWLEAVAKNQGKCEPSVDNNVEIPEKGPEGAPTENPGAKAKENLKKVINQNSIVYGAAKTLATAYQSCEASNKLPMNSETPEVQGIGIIGSFPGGMGQMRVIQNLQELLRSNYYFQRFQPSEKCIDVRKSPLIYDYGGKPYTPTAKNVINLFINAGLGTAALGIDCSAYVFTAIAAAGLKLSPEKKIKPILVHGINAVLYKEPEKNGMSCFEKISVGEAGTLRAGDIAAKKNHVMIIQSVGADPLGIAKAKTAVQCSQITSRNFDFVVAQSSASKNGIGINRFVAKDFLKESYVMRTGLEKYAQAACNARLQGRNILISGLEVQVIRHKLTASCIEQPIELVGESCVSDCLANK